MMKETATAPSTGVTTQTQQLVRAALFAALTCVATMIIKVPTPTQGYVHPGDGFVLLSGLLLGPLYGALAAGIGSALADLISGYVIYIPATFLIKAGCALVAYFTFRALSGVSDKGSFLIPKLLITTIAGEAVMVVGYFGFEIFMLAVVSHSSLSAGFVAALAGLVPNFVQASFGILLGTLLYPVFSRVVPAHR